MKKKTIRKEFFVIVIACVMLIIATAITAVCILKKDNIVIKDDMYQYIYGQKYEFKGKTIISRKNDKVTFKNNRNKINLNSKPLYYEDKDKILLPETMAVVMPQDTILKRLNKVSFVEIQDSNSYRVKNSNIDTVLSDSFLFDGKNLYVFLDAVTLSYDGEEITLSPLSYVSVVYDRSIEIFDYKNKKYTNKTLNNNDVIAKSSNGYSVNLSTDTLNRFDGKKQLLFSKPELLGELK